jgi:hydrogenase maturation protein HypF
LPEGDWRLLLTAILDDLARDIAPGSIAARFHNALAVWAGSVIRQQPFLDVVLGGGCFQNRLLAERTIEEILSTGRRSYLPSLVPPGDGGLAVGQLAVGLARFKK